jgi:hypothetical protein
MQTAVSLHRSTRGVLEVFLFYPHCSPLPRGGNVLCYAESFVPADIYIIEECCDFVSPRVIPCKLPVQGFESTSFSDLEGLRL